MSISGNITNTTSGRDVLINIQKFCMQNPNAKQELNQAVELFRENVAQCPRTFEPNSPLTPEIHLKDITKKLSDSLAGIQLNNPVSSDQMTKNASLIEEYLSSKIFKIFESDESESEKQTSYRAAARHLQKKQLEKLLNGELLSQAEKKANDQANEQAKLKKKQATNTQEPNIEEKEVHTISDSQEIKEEDEILADPIKDKNEPTIKEQELDETQKVNETAPLVDKKKILPEQEPHIEKEKISTFRKILNVLAAPFVCIGNLFKRFFNFLFHRNSKE